MIVGFGEDDPALRQQYLETLLNRVPSITSLQYFVNTKQNDFFLDLPIIVFNGPEKVEERLGEVRFAIGPKSFSKPIPGRRSAFTMRCVLLRI